MLRVDSSKLLGVVSVVLFFVGLLTWTKERQLVSSLIFMLVPLFLVLSWVIGTNQLVNVPFLGKIGVFAILTSVMCFTAAALCSLYGEIGMLRYDVLPQVFGGSFRLIPTVRWGMIHPYAGFSLPLTAAGVILFFSGLLLKTRTFKFIGKGGVRLPRKYVVAGGVTFFVGLSFILLGSACFSYVRTYSLFMSRKINAPPVYRFVTAEGKSKVLPLYVDFVFKPWCRCSLKGFIYTPSLKEITFLVFTQNAEEPLINLTSNKINFSLNLQPNTQYLFRIKNTLNHTINVVTSTEIKEFLSRDAFVIGFPLVVISLIFFSVSFLVSKRKEVNFKT